MDKTTANGMKPETVAESIVSCLLSGEEDVILAHASHQLAIVLRSLTPTLISRIMKHRAARQRRDTAVVKKEK